MSTLKTIIKDHITFRKQIIKLAVADLQKTYKGSALGWAWALIKPMITLFVFWFAFSVGLRSGKPVDGYPFFLWLLAGFTPWFYMQGMLPGGAGCIRSYKFMVTKMKFPVSVIPTFVSVSKLTVNLILTVLMFVLFMAFGYMPDWYWVQIPIYTLMMFVFFTVWGLFAGMISAMSKDFQNLVKSITTAVFWLSGIIYNVQEIEIPWIKAILSYNPITIVCSGYRHCMIDKTWFFEDLYSLRCYFIVLFVMIVLAIWAYRKLYKEIPDVI